MAGPDLDLPTYHDKAFGSPALVDCSDLISTTRTVGSASERESDRGVDKQSRRARPREDFPTACMRPGRLIEALVAAM